MSQIVRFNWPFYIASILGVVGATALLWAIRPNGVTAATITAGAALALWWAAASLLASHWVYDRSGLTVWLWLREVLKPPPRRWVNIHAGFDETSAALTAAFPSERPTILNIYDTHTTPERSIVRARMSQSTTPVSVSCHPSALPPADAVHDAVFLLLAAHEIRDPAVRTVLFRELYRILRPGGSVVIVEHLRDAANFVAYGPGFLHFLPRKEWLRLGAETGFVREREGRFTPFVRLLVWRKPQ